MNTDRTFRVVWRGGNIGIFTVTDSDHQYWDGAFVPNEIDEAQQFQSLVKALDIRQVYTTWQKGTRVVLHSGDGDIVQAVVLSLDDSNLMSVRFAYSPEVIEWIEKNVY